MEYKVQHGCSNAHYCQTGKLIKYKMTEAEEIKKNFSYILSILLVDAIITQRI